MGEQKPKQSIKQKFKMPAIILAVLGALILIGAIISIPPLISQPTPQATYNFIRNNFNTTAINTSLSPQIITINSTIPIKNYTTIVFPNGTYLYYFGAKFCPFCASLSYATYSISHNNTIPAYNTNFYSAEGNVPAIPISQILANGSIKGIDAMYLYENPITTTELQDEPNYQVANLTNNWEKGLPPTVLYLFAMHSSYPDIYIVHTNGSKTTVCNAYQGINIYQYNQTTMTALSSNFNTKGLPLNSVIPDTNNIEQEQSLIYDCIQKIG